MGALRTNAHLYSPLVVYKRAGLLVAPPIQPKKLSTMCRNLEYPIFPRKLNFMRQYKALARLLACFLGTVTGLGCGNSYSGSPMRRTISL